MSKNISIEVPILARVEGDGALALTIQDQKITTLQLKIFEPPRLFEKFLETRSYQEILDIVARICGICPVAYQMSAVHAIEDCFKVQPHAWVREMRRVFYCGEWIESHSLHIHLLAAPDILGFDTAAEMAKTFPDEVKRGLRLQSFGNALIRLLGGRSVHPVGACVGGFYRAPYKAEVDAVLQQGRACLNECEALIAWLASLPLPHYQHDFTAVSLYHPTEYPMCEGNIVSDDGLNIAKEEFDAHFKEFQVPYSNALHCLLHGKSYLVGPLARVNHCFGHLPDFIHVLLQHLKISFPTHNMHHSILARAIEIYYAVFEAVRILSHYSEPEASSIEVKPIAGTGYGCTEAPRGLLWQSYTFDKEGKVSLARIVPPTSQNQARIEDDLRHSIDQFGLNHSVDELRFFCERVIRNYDPCISCSTHFLKLTLEHL